MSKITFQTTTFFNPDAEIHSHIIGYEAVEMHSHGFIEFFFVLSGQCIHNLNGTKNKIETGDAFLLTPADEHMFINSHDNCKFLHRDILIPFDYFQETCNVYSPTLYNDILNNKYHLHFTLSSPQINQIEQLLPFVMLNKDKVAAKALCLTILNFVLAFNYSKMVSYPDWITRIMSQMCAPNNMKYPLEYFTNTVPLTQAYMCREFKKHIGMTLTEYFNKQKLLHAASLLQSTNMSIEQIEEAVGFHNSAHFYTSFKKEFDMTPNKMRGKN